MNKSELIAEVSERTGFSKSDVDLAVSALLDTISDTVADGEKVSLVGFGTFERRDRPARTARNPQTGESVKVAKTKVPAFKAGTTFKKYTAMSKKDQLAVRKARG